MGAWDIELPGDQSNFLCENNCAISAHDSGSPLLISSNYPSEYLLAMNVKFINILVCSDTW